MIDERFAARVTSWLRRTDHPARQPEGNVARAMAQIYQTRQRRRWLWFLPGPKPTARADGRASRAGTTPSVTTRPIGGTIMLFSPSKLLTAAAGVTLAAALMLVGPFTTQDTVEPIAPAADTELPGVTLVNGVMELTSQDFPGNTEALDRGYSITGALRTGEFTMSDERLSGRARIRGNAHADEMTWVWTESVYLENDGGAWVGTGYGYFDPASTGGELGSGNHDRLVLVGQGGYAGLTAIIDLDAANYDAPVEVTGAIVPFDLPQVPHAAPTTFE